VPQSGTQKQTFMKSILTVIVMITLGLFAQNVQAQEDSKEEKQPKGFEKRFRRWKERAIQDSLQKVQSVKEQIAQFNQEKEGIRSFWKEDLKSVVRSINKRVEKEYITSEEAEVKKKEAAEKIARNMENQLAIVDNKIALLERNGTVDPTYWGTSLLFGLGHEDKDGTRVFGFALNKRNGRSRRFKYDKRSTYDLTYAFGWNNAFTDVSDLGDTFSLRQSGFAEFGFNWNTRILENSGALHFRYGLSFQWNKLDAEDNQFFTVSNEVATLETFDVDLRKSQLRNSNIVVPLHLEFGGYKKIEKKNYIRYKTRGKFRMGIGGYAGVRLGTQQKLRFRRDGERVNTKERTDFGGDTFVYGISSYVRIWGDISIYGKYDLSSAINAPELGEVNNVSLGFRFDL